VGKTLFGDRMDDVVRVLAGGSEALAKMRAEFEALHPGMEANGKAGGELNPQFDKLTDTGKTDLRDAFLPLAPIPSDIISSVDAVIKRGDLIGKYGQGAIGALLARQALGQNVSPRATSNARRLAEDASMAALGTGAPDRLKAGGALDMDEFEKKILK